MHLDDGTRLDIIDGDDVIQEDGSVLGWREYEIPEGKQSDSITVKARLFRIKQIMFQDGSTFKRNVESGEKTEVFFSLHRNNNYICLKGTSSTDVYQAQAELAFGKVDMHGTVRVTAPEWANVWVDWEALEKMDIINSWNLYQNGQLINTHGTEEMRAVDKEGMVYELVLPRMDNVEGLTLVPEYSKSGEHPDEAISIEKNVK